MYYSGLIMAVLFIGGLVTIFVLGLWRPQWGCMSPRQKLVLVLCIIGLTLLIVLVLPGDAARAWPATSR